MKRFKKKGRSTDSKALLGDGNYAFVDVEEAAEARNEELLLSGVLRVGAA